MKKTAGLAILFAFSLLAAEFWQKPYTEWSDKDVVKMVTNSPWAKSNNLSMGPAGFGGGPAPITPGGNAEGGGGFGGSGGGGGRGGGPQGGGGFEGGGGDGASLVRAVEVAARWQTALPVRQAFVRLKFGAEADKSADAKKILDEEVKSYEIVLSGPIQPMLKGKPDDLAKALSEVTSLSSSRTGAIKPSQIEMSRSPKSVDVLFVFPKSMPFTAEDKEVEFSTKIGPSTLKYKFKPKEMMFNGKLEM